MIMDKNPIEKRLEKRRKITSIILTLIFHFIFILILLISGAFKIEKNENKVITVQLHDKIIEDFNKMDEAKKEKIIKETQKKYESIRKKEQKKQDNIKQENKIKEESKKEDKTKEDKINEKVIDKSNYDDYKKKIEETKKREEEEFFKSSSSKKDDKYDDNIDDLLNYKIDEDAGGGKKEGQTDKKRGTDGNIKWEEGKSRELIYKGKIIAPDEIVQKGLKVNLTIKFTVNKNGFIERVIILESTGNILWDNYIIEQFKKNYIFKESNVNSIGITEITINY